MSDAAVRIAERAWRASGSLEDACAYDTACLRAGVLSAPRRQLLARLVTLLRHEHPPTRLPSWVRSGLHLIRQSHVEVSERGPYFPIVSIQPMNTRPGLQFYLDVVRDRARARKQDERRGAP